MTTINSAKDSVLSEPIPLTLGLTSSEFRHLYCYNEDEASITRNPVGYKQTTFKPRQLPRKMFGVSGWTHRVER